jgi:cytoplasmic iron level regulating protein YaaA (DUF328/UPF0246 family)
MLAVISPAKKMSAPVPNPKFVSTSCDFLQDSENLSDTLRKLSPSDVSKLMDISANLGELNFGRFQTWTSKITKENGSQAIFAFQGDVYQGIDIESLTDAEVHFAQAHLRILSGLYGVLRPLDLLLPYRLEMGTKLQTERGKNLYEFWGDKITENLYQTLENQKDKVLINLASEEYFKSVNQKKLNSEIITPIFKDFKDGTYKMISFYAKKARGMMVRYILEHKIQNPDELKGFTSAGYAYNAAMSTPQMPVFLRG